MKGDDDMSIILDELDKQEHSFQNKMKKAVKKAKEVGQAGLEWTVENKELIALSIPVILFGIKKVDKHLDIAKQTKLKECSIYDHSMGMYLVSKKPLTTAQKLDIDAMHKAGMSYAEIGKKLKIDWK